MEPTAVDAAVDGDVDFVEKLLNSGHAVDARDDNLLAAGATLLQHATIRACPADDGAEAGAGQLAVMRLLLGRGADPNAGTEGWTPLATAAANGGLAAAEVLLNAGADANARCHTGETALSHAATRGDAAMIRLLLRAGADPEPGDADRARFASPEPADPGCGHAAARTLLEDALRGDMALE